MYAKKFTKNYTNGYNKKKFYNFDSIFFIHIYLSAIPKIDLIAVGFGKGLDSRI